MKIAYLVWWYTFICLSSIFFRGEEKVSHFWLASPFVRGRGIFIFTFAWILAGPCKRGIDSLLLNKNRVTCITKKSTTTSKRGGLNGEPKRVQICKENEFE